MPIPENISRVRDRIERAAERAGRNPDEISLMAVSKTFGPEQIREAYSAGLRLFGENRVQEFAGKIDSLRDLPDADWHLIGHLQSNKASKAVELFSAVDSVDSARLAEKLDSSAENLGKNLRLLIEVNVGGEEAKSGVDPNSGELENILLAAERWPSLEICGLMTIPPFTDNPASARPYFRTLRELRDQIVRRKLPAVSMGVLSMGMSHDFEVAIEEGSTCVRLGTAIFGERKKP